MATAMDAEKWSDEYEDAKCSICAKDNKDEIADHYCYDCNKHMCTSCLGTHNKFIENHNVVQGRGDDKDVLTEKCGKHADELVTLYCRQHEELKCEKCRLWDHKEVTTKVHDINTQGAVGREVDIPVQAIVKSPGDRQVGRPVEKQGDRPVVRPEKKQINVRIPEDKYSCIYIGCCHLNDGSLVVTDFGNNRLKCVDPSSSKVTKYCDTDQTPLDVCCIGPQEIAVSFEHSTQVGVYNTISLTRTRTVELGHQTLRIVCHGGLLYCVGPVGDILYVYDVSSGRKLREISMDTDDQQLLSVIHDIAVNSSGDRLYVTDAEICLLCVNVDGRRIFHLSMEDLGLSKSYCMTSDHRGHLFVCGLDCESHSYNVVKVTEDGHVVGQILSMEDGIKWPECLSYDVTRSQLCVGGDSEQLLMVKL